MDENATRILPEMRMFQLVVDEDVALLRMIAFIDRHHRQYLGAGKMLGRPF